VTVVNPGTSEVSNVVFLAVVAPSSLCFIPMLRLADLLRRNGVTPNEPLSMVVGISIPMESWILFWESKKTATQAI